MARKQILWLIPLLVSGCAMTGEHNPQFVAGPLQPNNCGTPYEFKPCGRLASGPVQGVKPRVTIEELAGTTAEEVTPGSTDLRSPTTPAISQNRY